MGERPLKASGGNVDLARCILQRSVEAHTLRPKLDVYILCTVEEGWKKNRMDIHLYNNQGGSPKICSAVWADMSWVMSHSKVHLEAMMKLIGKSRKMGLGTKPASLWLSSTHAGEVEDEMAMKTNTKGQRRLPFTKEACKLWDECSHHPANHKKVLKNDCRRPRELEWVDRKNVQK